MSAEILREAARLMRERAEKATSGPWEFRPRRGFQMISDDPATIGFNDDAGYFVMLREGTWATESDMDYVASWHPDVALAVADWLEADATVIERHDLDVTVSKAYDVARRYLGEQP